MEDPREDRGWRAVRDILSYEPDRDVWTKHAEMKFPRLSHGVSAVSVTEEIMRACRTERTVVDNSVYGGVTLIITSQHCCYLGMLITGGYQDPHSRMALRSAEVFLPSSNSSCRLGEMRWPRYRHSQTGLLACGGEGGEDSRGSCELSGGGGWTREVRLQSGGRTGHIAWTVNDSVLLMGDLTDQDSHATTTEIIGANTNTSDMFYQLRVKVR